MRVQKRIENDSPAKKVEAERAVWPVRRPRTADTVQQDMITMIAPMIKRRIRCGVNMG